MPVSVLVPVPVLVLVTQQRNLPPGFYRHSPRNFAAQSS